MDHNVDLDDDYDDDIDDRDFFLRWTTTRAILHTLSPRFAITRISSPFEVRHHPYDHHDHHDHHDHYDQHDHRDGQGPMAHTVADFWQMVWEQGSVVLVMLSRCSICS